jgi:hypothetical protein
MEASKLPDPKCLAGAGKWLAKLSRFKILYMVSTSGYCAIHWLVTHSFSFYILSSALVFGAVAVMAAAWLSDWFSTPSQT